MPKPQFSHTTEAGQMQRAISQPNTNSPVLFLPGIFNETLALLHQAHRYFHTHGATDQASMNAQARMIYATEMSRVTLRLTSVMAWIMVRRAVHAGNIDAARAENDYRLDGDHDATVALPLAHMPEHLRYLSARSHALYARAARLDGVAE